MKAVYIDEFGGPEKLKYGHRPDPVPGPDEVLVRVKACALNRIDIWGRTGTYSQTMKLPRVLGADIAGVVEATGPQARRFRKGDRVLLNPAVTCGSCESCLSGQHGLCPKRNMLGIARDGGYAELVVIPEINVHPIPPHLPFEEAAAIPVAFMTAWHMLIHRAHLKAGEDLLIMAAGSGVGSAAIQVAKKLGARVFVTASTDEKLSKARELGADFAINYAREDFSQRVRKLTSGRGVDVVLDPVGASVFEKCLASLARTGRYVNCGVTSGSQVTLDIRATLLQRSLWISGSEPIGHKMEMRQILRLVDEGAFRGVVGRTFPLEAAAEAHSVMESRDFFGKLVLQVPS